MSGSNLVNRLAAAGTLVALQGAPAAAQWISEADAQRLLTPAEVERASGLKGVHRVARYSVPQAGGDLNFAVGPTRRLC